MPPHLICLPNELVTHIASLLGPAELNALLQTHRDFATILAPLARRYVREASWVVSDFIEQYTEATETAGAGFTVMADTAWITSATRAAQLEARSAHVAHGGLHIVDKQPLLADALLAHRGALLRLLLDAGADVHECFPRGLADTAPPAPLLLLAAEWRCTELVRLLLARGADVHAATADGETAAHRLCASGTRADGDGDVALVALLAQRGLDLNRRCGPQRWAPLHLAARRMHSASLLRALLGNGADVHAIDAHGCTPLHFLAGVHEGAAAALSVLRDAGADVNARNALGETPLIWAADRRNLDLMRVLVEQAGADTTLAARNGLTALHRVAGLPPKQINDDGRIVNYGYFCHSVAVTRRNHIAMVLYLLQHGADVNASAPLGTALHFAVSVDAKQVVEVLLQHGADVNALVCTTPLHCAATFGRMEVARMLLERGAQPDMRDEEGLVPLLCAALNGHAGLVPLLVRSGADINAVLYAQPTTAWTALHVAAAGSHVDFVKALLEEGARDCHRDSRGRTALEIAVGAGHTAVVALLLKTGPTGNMGDKSICTGRQK